MPNFKRRFSLMEQAGDDKSGSGSATPPAPRELETFSREYVSELRGENATYRTKAKEESAKREAAELAAKHATESADAKVKEAQTASEQRIIRAELKAAALKAGMVDLDGLKLADLSKIKLDDKGEVEGAEALMEEMKKSKPYLFGSTASTSSTEKPPASTPPAAKKASEMTAEEYAAARKSIK